MSASNSADSPLESSQPATSTDTTSTDTASIDTASLMLQLRRKQGGWVEWGQAIQQLQKSGLSQQAIFEETGFEATHQNQVTVGAQVYGSLAESDVPDMVKEHFSRKGSDILYEFRILPHHSRAHAAHLVLQHSLDLDDAREVTKAMRNYARLKQIPDGYDSSAGDAVSYDCWRLARQSEDLQSRSRLIARGLRFSTSDAARHALEKLLTDFTSLNTRQAPRLPVFRLENDAELPRIVPVIGQLPLPKADYQAVPVVVPEGEFDIVKFSGTGAWVALPGWQVLLNAEDAVALVADGEAITDTTQATPGGAPLKGPVLVVVDRGDRQWNGDHFYLVERDDTIAPAWWSEHPDEALLGRVLLVLRPQKVLDRDYVKDPWQIDE